MNAKTIAAALTATACLAGAVPVATAAQMQVMKPNGMVMKPTVPPLKLSPHLSCVFRGTPVEFPNSVLLTNDGPIPVAAGTYIRIIVNGRQWAAYTFSKALPRKGHIFVHMARENANGAPCTVQFGKIRMVLPGMKVQGH